MKKLLYIIILIFLISCTESNNNTTHPVPNGEVPADISKENNRLNNKYDNVFNNLTIESMQDSITKLQQIIDSLNATHKLLIDYYCFTEKMLDSIYQHSDGDMIFDYDFRIYNRIVDTIYYNHFHLYIHMDTIKEHLELYYIE